MLGRIPRTWPLAVVVPSVALAATLAVARPQGRAPAEVPGNAGIAPKVAVAPFKYYGADSCIRCHQQPLPTDKISLENITHREYAVWDKWDKHRLAYTMLTAEKAPNVKGRGQEMAERLGVDVLKPEAGCLGCHSASPAEANKENRVGDDWKVSDGVSCENCHGPAEKWYGDHSQSTWRARSSDEKGKLGMNDLRDPIRQASKCMSCHIGSVEEGKVVTHAMYAVGHPPLPSIDVGWFSDEIPRHWRMLSEKDKPVLNDKGEPVRPSFHKVGDSLERSRLATVGAGMALKTAMKLMADESRKQGSTTPGHAWPDYARFDCASCHHELERPSWRQERGFDGPPGRPPVNRWPLVVLSLGLDHLAPGKPGLIAELKAHETALGATTQARPFGRKADLAKAADDFAAWADGVTVRLAEAKYDAKAVKEMLVKLVTEASKSDLDYEAARYVVWTSVSFLHDLDRDPIPYPVEKPIGRPAKADPTLRPIFERLFKNLHLDLPTGQEAKIEAALPNALQRMGNYDPRPFRADLIELLPLIEK